MSFYGLYIESFIDYSENVAKRFNVNIRNLLNNNLQKITYFEFAIQL